MDNQVPDLSVIELLTPGGHSRFPEVGPAVFNDLEYVVVAEGLHERCIGEVPHLEAIQPCGPPVAFPPGAVAGCTMRLVIRQAASGSSASHARCEDAACRVGRSGGGWLNWTSREKDKVDDQQPGGEDRGQREEPPTS